MRDIADLLNIRPKYHRGRSTCPSELSVSTIILGDSFSNQLQENIIQSGFCTIDSAIGLGNHMPSKDDWFRQLNKAELLVLTYIYPKLKENKIKKGVARLLNYTDDFILKNWYLYEKSGNGQWSKYHSSVEFFHDTRNDCTFYFTVKYGFKSKELCLFINEYKIIYH